MPDEPLTDERLAAEVAPSTRYRPQLVAEGHVPTIAETGHETPAWGVHCYACSVQAEDYVWPCRESVDYEVPAELVALDDLTAARAEVARLTALITAPDGGGIPAPLLLEMLSMANHAEGLDVADYELLDHHRTETYRMVAESVWSVAREQVEELTAEVQRRGEANRELSALYADTCRKLDAANAVLKAIDEHVGLMESEIGDHQDHDYNVRDHDETLQAGHTSGRDAEHERITYDLRRLLGAVPAAPVPAPAELCAMKGCHADAVTWGVCGPHFDATETCDAAGHDPIECSCELTAADAPVTDLAAAPVVAEATQAKPRIWPCGDPRCDTMHCPRCGKHCGGQGHYTGWCANRRGPGPSHMCCPDACELTQPDAVPAAAADRPVA